MVDVPVVFAAGRVEEVAGANCRNAAVESAKGVVLSTGLFDCWTGVSL